MRFRSTLLGLAVLAAPAVAQTAPDWAAPGAGPAPAAVESSVAPPTPPPPPPPVPVDGGLALLALAGAGYASHRLARRR